VAGHAQANDVEVPVVFDYHCDTVAVFSRLGREVPHTRRFWADVVDSVQHAGRKSGTVGQK
jgi:hypothetical protein